jgi:hypothetical protein
MLSRLGLDDQGAMRPTRASAADQGVRPTARLGSK